jgi:hypothetical protein
MILYHPVRIGMIAESILERINQTPFQPLAVQRSNRVSSFLEDRNDEYHRPDRAKRSLQRY